MQLINQEWSHLATNRRKSNVYKLALAVFAHNCGSVEIPYTFYMDRHNICSQLSVIGLSLLTCMTSSKCCQCGLCTSPCAWHTLGYSHFRRYSWEGHILHKVLNLALIYVETVEWFLQQKNELAIVCSIRCITQKCWSRRVLVNNFTIPGSRDGGSQAHESLKTATTIQNTQDFLQIKPYGDTAE